MLLPNNYQGLDSTCNNTTPLLGTLSSTLLLQPRLVNSDFLLLSLLQFVLRWSISPNWLTTSKTETRPNFDDSDENCRGHLLIHHSKLKVFIFFQTRGPPATVGFHLLGVNSPPAESELAPRGFSTPPDLPRVDYEQQRQDDSSPLWIFACTWNRATRLCAFRPKSMRQSPPPSCMGQRARSSFRLRLV